jgi:hypothetical protein
MKNLSSIFLFKKLKTKIMKTKIKTQIVLMACVITIQLHAQTPPPPEQYSYIHQGGGQLVGGSTPQISRTTQTNIVSSTYAALLAFIQQQFNQGKTLAQTVCNSTSIVSTAKPSELIRATISVFGGSERQLVIAMKPCWGYDKITKGLLDAYGYTYNQIAQKLKDAGASAQEVFDALRNGVNAGIEVAITAIAEAGYLAADIIKVVNNVGMYTLNEIGGLLKARGFDPNQISKGFKDGLNKGGQFVAGLLKDLNYGGVTIGNALKSSYNVSYDTIAGWLNSTGFSANKIIEFGVNAFHITAETGAKVLKNLGVTSERIANAIKEGITTNINTIADALNKAGFNFETAAKALKNIETDATKVAKALKDIYQKNVTEVATAMFKAGYALSIIGNAISQVFGIAQVAVDAILNLLK